MELAFLLIRSALRFVESTLSWRDDRLVSMASKRFISSATLLGEGFVWSIRSKYGLIWWSKISSSKGSHCERLSLCSISVKKVAGWIL